MDIPEVDSPATPTIAARHSSSSPPPWSKSVDLLLDSTVQSSNENILRRLEHFKAKYEQMLAELDCSLSRIGQCQDYTSSQLKRDLAKQYEEKVYLTKQNMLRVSGRISSIQLRLNAMRKSVASKQALSLVERGPFQYRCVAPDGVCYREYPSKRAGQAAQPQAGRADNGAMVVFNEVVEISERVCMLLYVLSPCMQQHYHRRGLICTLYLD